MSQTWSRAISFRRPCFSRAADQDDLQTSIPSNYNNSWHACIEGLSVAILAKTVAQSATFMKMNILFMFFSMYHRYRINLLFYVASSLCTFLMVWGFWQVLVGVSFSHSKVKNQVCGFYSRFLFLWVVLKETQLIKSAGL